MTKMMQKDAFYLLGLPLTASPDEVSKAYRNSAMAAHRKQGGKGEAERLTILAEARTIATRAARETQCLKCDGTGKQQIINGIYSLGLTCSYCQGSKKLHG